MTTRAVRRALLSVYDKNGIVELATGLSAAGVELVSTGGTARALAAAGLPVREVSELTGYPEMMDGRVKTLHPKIHGGLLAVRDNPHHMGQAREHGIEMIDLVAINLYPFERTYRENPGDREALIEMIDIGGPALIRSAAKNCRDVTVVVDPRDYGQVLAEVRSGGVREATREALAARAFAHTAAYDALIAATLRPPLDAGDRERLLPETMTLAFRKSLDLRYGENPHQAAALYLDPLETGPSAATAEKLQGKDLGFNNILDLDAAWQLACELAPPACAIIKHTNPAGAALGASAAEAFRLALACDPLSAFGGIVALNVKLDVEAAREIASLFLEAVIAPGFEPAALEVLRSRPGLRVLATGAVSRLAGGLDYKGVVGGMLAQTRDAGEDEAVSARTVTRRSPTPGETEALKFAWTVVRHVKSNAIVYAKGTATVGVGAGQMSRVDAVRLGASKARASLEGSVLSSDAFFPFRDGVDEAASAGVTAIIQPGGSVKDAEVIAAADEHDIAMVFTGRRHFKH